MAKLYGYWIIVNYREAYGIFACNGILFNHESPRRGETFCPTRKITQAAARIKNGSKEVLSLGNLNAKRDWGYAPEFCLGMWQMLQQNKPDDFVLATGEQHTVREFAELSFAELGININWEGENEKEIGVNSQTGDTIVNIDPRYYRPTEVDTLLGDSSKAKNILGWQVETSFNDLVKIMVRADYEKLKMSKILVTGSTGMVGRNVVDLLSMHDYDLLTPSRTELNLENLSNTIEYFKREKPQIVIHCAGLVGGIQANLSRPIEFLTKNIDINKNLIMSSAKMDIKKLINLGSSCIYPKNANNPLSEDQIMTGQLEPSNEGYAIAKIMAIKLVIL